MAKKAFPLTSRKKYLASVAVSSLVKIGDMAQLIATPKQFESGNVGLFAGGKVIIMVDGVPVEHQVSMSVTAIGSKDSPAE